MMSPCPKSRLQSDVYCRETDVMKLNLLSLSLIIITYHYITNLNSLLIIIVRIV